MEQWASGRFTDLHKYSSATLNAKAIGKMEVLDNVLNLDYLQAEGVLSDD